MGQKLKCKLIDHSTYETQTKFKCLQKFTDREKKGEREGKKKKCE